jgi:hypothetical protein
MIGSKSRREAGEGRSKSRGSTSPKTAVAWRAMRQLSLSRSRELRRSAPGSADNLTLKPSELKKLARTPGSKGSSRGGGATDVLRQISDMRHKLQAHSIDRRKHEKQLQEVLDEFLKTENNYLLDMQHTCEKFAEPLHKCCDTPPHSKLHGQIFANLETLTELHRVLNRDIESQRMSERQKHHGEKSDLAAAEGIMAAFLKLLPFFKMYATYW